MKTNKPHHINYNSQYQLMRLAQHLLPLMPETILDRFSAHKTSIADWADDNAAFIHPDRYDIAQDWHCTVQSAIHHKISSTK